MAKKCKNICCVVGCSNTYKNTHGVRFFSLPHRSWEIERKNAWTRAVNRINADGSPWQPTKLTRICSLHFEGGQPINHPESPAYVPTIFPSQYKRKKPSNRSTKFARFHRAQKRKKSSSASASGNNPQQEQQNTGGETKAARARPRKDTLHPRPDVSSAQATPSTSSVGSKVQSSTVTSHPSTTELADPLFVACPSPAFVDVSTHRVPPPDLRESSAWRPRVETVPARALKSLENDDGELDLDRLFSSYMCNSGVLTLTGIKMSVFRLLLSLLPPVFRSHGLSKENCLLTFLLQMKTGMASYTVETLFCIPRATEATNIFHTCMSHLKESTQQFIVWPDKKTVISTMPDKFTTSFSNCRVILYCLAVHLEPPNWSDLQSGWYKSPSERCRKMIIGFTPLGTVSFVSKSFPGDTTFANLILKSGVLDLIEPEDGVYVVSDDEQREEFDWEPLIADPRLKCISVFKPNDTLRKASIWAHSMHQIRRLKSYKILYNFSWELRETVESVVNMACVLANLQPLQ